MTNRSFTCSCGTVFNWNDDWWTASCPTCKRQYKVKREFVEYDPDPESEYFNLSSGYEYWLEELIKPSNESNNKGAIE